MKILAIDSSSKTASAAVVQDGNPISSFFINAGLTHSQTLAPMIDSVLKYANLSADEIDCYAVTVGPGSFTGLRIGLATIKGLAFVNDKPCVAVSSLEALAHNFQEENGIICACMDARRDQCYNAIFKCENGVISRLTPDRATTFDELVEDLIKITKETNSKEKVSFFGDGAIICYNNINTFNLENKIKLSSPRCRYIDASVVADLAALNYKAGKAKSVHEICLNYLRLPQAERLLRERLLKVNGGSV